MTNSSDGIKALLLGKTGKKLCAFSLGVFLLIAVLVFSASLSYYRNIILGRMDDHLGDIPRIVDSCKKELALRSRIYEDDVLARAELGLKLFMKVNGIPDAEKLERVRAAVSADSVSLLDGQKQLLDTTGSVSPEETVRSCLQSLEPRDPRLELYPALSKDGETAGKNDGRGFVLLPIPGSMQRSLLFEFPCETLLEMYNEISDWSAVLERMLSGVDASAFAKTGDRLAGFPLDGLTPEQTSQLYEDLAKVFQNSGSFQIRGNRRPSKIITLLGERYLAALMHLPAENTDILMTVPYMDVFRTGFFIALAISSIIGCGMAMFQLYVFRILLRKKGREGPVAVSRSQLSRATLPGMLVVLAVTVLFSSMLLLLENRTNAVFTAKAKRETIQYEIDLRRSQEDMIRSTFVNCYLARAEMLAGFLTEYPDYQVRDGLEELNRIAGTDYLMRFDSAGQELASSNSYTGFAVGTNLSEEYRAVLMGYPYAVAGPAADPYTGRIQLGTAIMMTDADRQPDGFLLAVYGAEDLAAELERMSYESAVSSFALQAGQIAAAISDEDGRFIASSDPGLIGQKAEDYLDDFESGSSFEGFTEFRGKGVYVSAVSSDGKTLVSIVPEHLQSYMQAGFVLQALAVLLILALLYFPAAGLLCAQAMAEADGKLQSPARLGNPLMVFPDGYFTFLTLFAAFALIVSSKGLWPAFDYVFSGQWSKGVHLFSIWAALFVAAFTLFLAFLLRTVLQLLERRLSLRARTITRLVNSLVAYAAGVFLFFCILDMFGVNTTALLASAGIISIAVGMGAQSMASDLLAGFLMMMEGTVHVGDYVSVAGITGHVTDMGIRHTEITDDEGNVVLLNNSQVGGVTSLRGKQARKEQKSDPKATPEIEQESKQENEA